ncbi:DUF3606 domain-containing protein [Ramlibacter sp. AW1]|uniref:DUF3606 domain-containing protein n=1 Tax=Ramlibacter aurantiacus TaxID=2801330 RepID=A0A936ZN65_9BURK|nr:DUF3606 domain-containing protein [Ramlibacter aurantiacus]MBL0420751.1 DUF3606 domain-containing protein [Ramlibacter aurantiacus]
MAADNKPVIRDADRIDTSHDYAVGAWARHFNVSVRDVKEAVAAVGDRAVRVKEHLTAGRSVRGSERPSA